MACNGQWNNKVQSFIKKKKFSFKLFYFTIFVFNEGSPSTAKVAVK